MRAGRGLLPVLAGTMVATVVGCAGGTSTTVGSGGTAGTSTSRSAPDAGTGSTPASRSPQAPSTPGATVPPARRAASVLVPAAPSEVVLPSGRTVPVRAVGTTGAGLLAVPDDIRVAGWWRGGSRLGDPFGATLVAAHVDSRTQGLGPFAELLSVAAGTRVRLESDRVRQDFEVRSRELVPQGPLDPRRDLFRPGGERRLFLVTCAPPYDASRGGYQNLAVLTAVPLGPPEQR